MVESVVSKPYADWKKALSLCDLRLCLTLVVIFTLPGILTANDGSNSTANADPDRAQLELQLRKVEKAGNPKEVYDASMKLAAHLRTVEAREEALRYYKNAVDVALNASYPGAAKDAAQGLNVLGRHYQYMDQYGVAMQTYTEALRRFEALGDSTGMAACLGSIGNMHLILNDYEEARRFTAAAYSMALALRDSVRIMHGLNNLGVVHQKLGEHATARGYYIQALELNRAKKDLWQQGVAMGNIGSCYVSEGNTAEGIEALHEALRLKTEGKASAKSIMHTLNDLATANLEAGRPGEAARYALTVIDSARAIGDGYSLKYGQLHLSMAYRDLGDYRAAYAAQRKYIHINDSLFGLEKAKQISELKLAYETEKKDRAIVELEQEREEAAFRQKVYAGAAILLLLLAGAVYNRQRLKARASRELLEKEQEVDRLKRNFFANISHEFRTPLTLLMGPISAMLERTSSENERRELQLMERNTLRLLRLINDILDLSKLDEGHLGLHPEPCQLEMVLRGIALQFGSLATERHIAYDVIVNPHGEFEDKATAAPVMLDRNRMETIINNLLSNAFKFTPPEGKVTFTAQWTQGQQAIALTLRIADTGKGIPPEKLERIFDRYYQVDDSATRKEQGTGIGLAFTRELVHLHGGSIRVESEVGKGTTVSVHMELPFAPAEAALRLSEPELTPKTPFGEKATRTAIGAPPTYAHTAEELTDDEWHAGDENASKPLLLLAEDDEDVRTYLKMVLHEEYRLAEAPDGEAGIEQAFNHVPDLIISDVMMPGMDGYTLCSRLKADERTSHIPIILLTAKSSTESRIEGLERRADVYLNKPFLPKELKLHVHNLIASRAALRQKYRRAEGIKPGEVSVNSVDEQFMVRLNALLEQRYSDPELTAEILAREVGMSRSQLHRKLAALTGDSATQVMRSFRLQRAMQLLKAHSGSISEIAYSVGFNNVSYFNKCFLEMYGMRPGEVGK